MLIYGDVTNYLNQNMNGYRRRTMPAYLLRFVPAYFKIHLLQTTPIMEWVKDNESQKRLALDPKLDVSSMKLKCSKIRW